jgi:hypothetical protein
MKKPLYAELATLIQARANCLGKNPEWHQKHTERILTLVKEHLPSGSGVDAGCQIDLQKSEPDKLVILTSFHHMNEHGMYDGWTDHTVTVRPSLAFTFTLTISGPNRNDIKELLHEAFEYDLRKEVE